jgi:hypothetical protein
VAVGERIRFKNEFLRALSRVLRGDYGGADKEKRYTGFY